MGSGGSTEQAVHMNSGRKRLANGIEMRRHSPIPGEMNINEAVLLLSSCSADSL